MITFLLIEIDVEPGWAIGSVPLDDPTLDRDVLVDYAGSPWVPGSSLAGSLRAYLAATDRAARTTLETDLMGARPTQHRDDQAAVSPLWFLGTRFTPSDTTDTIFEVTGQTRIDHHRKAAAARSLRSNRSVSAGGKLTAYLRYDEELTGDHLAALARWRPSIGRDRTTGGGRARLRRLRHGSVDPATADGARLWLNHSGEKLVEAVATTDVPIPTADCEPWLNAAFTVEDALLVTDPRPTGPASPRTRNGQYIVPGSAWKGIIRSRVEYIVRSLYGRSPDLACDNPTVCQGCVVCEVFGHHRRRGRLAFATSVIETAEQSSGRTQVGIDRVTGGSCAGLLFETQPVTSGRLELRIDDLGPHGDEGPLAPWVRTAIEHVLLDIHDGLVGVGSRVTRGMGTLKLVSPLPRPGPVTIPDREPGTPQSTLAEVTC
jgi:CRISPR/Cas system CSM-associated protein Csm3 (group 7 of RAMP superfamily)